MGLFAIFLILFLLFSVNPSFSRIVSSSGEGCSSDIKKAKEEALKKAKINAINKEVGILISQRP